MDFEPMAEKTDFLVKAFLDFQESAPGKGLQEALAAPGADIRCDRQLEFRAQAFKQPGAAQVIETTLWRPPRE